jgi:hypothetical protein
MTLFDSLKGVLAQYASGTASPQDAEGHFSQVAQHADRGSLSDGIAAAMRSDQTPPFAQMMTQLFTHGSGDQKAGMLNTLLGAASPELRAQLSGLVPSLGGSGSVSPTEVGSVAPDVVGSVAQQIEQHNPGVIDQMRGFYAQHPTLVKSLGTAAMMIAMRKMAERQA